jgi:endonuclease YncB( thermonuclease family)
MRKYFLGAFSPFLKWAIVGVRGVVFGVLLSFILFMAGLEGIPEAKADVSGPVCVENGGVISVNGRRHSGTCVDGTVVRLYGVKAPPLDQDCQIGGDEVWRCGLASAAALLQAVQGQQVECRGNSIDNKGRLLAICFVAGRSLNQFMVEMGWAGADKAVSTMFVDFEAEARATKRGLWSSNYRPQVD